MSVEGYDPARTASQLLGLASEEERGAAREGLLAGRLEAKLGVEQFKPLVGEMIHQVVREKEFEGLPKIESRLPSLELWFEGVVIGVQMKVQVLRPVRGDVKVEYMLQNKAEKGGIELVPNSLKTKVLTKKRDWKSKAAFWVAGVDNVVSEALGDVQKLALETFNLHMPAIRRILLPGDDRGLKRANYCIMEILANEKVRVVLGYRDPLCSK